MGLDHEAGDIHIRAAVHDRDGLRVPIDARDLRSGKEAGQYRCRDPDGPVLFDRNHYTHCKVLRQKYICIIQCGEYPFICGILILSCIRGDDCVRGRYGGGELITRRVRIAMVADFEDVGVKIRAGTQQRVFTRELCVPHEQQCSAKEIELEHQRIVVVIILIQKDRTQHTKADVLREEDFVARVELQLGKLQILRELVDLVPAFLLVQRKQR